MLDEIDRKAFLDYARVLELSVSPEEREQRDEPEAQKKALVPQQQPHPHPSPSLSWRPSPSLQLQVPVLVRGHVPGRESQLVQEARLGLKPASSRSWPRGWRRRQRATLDYDLEGRGGRLRVFSVRVVALGGLEGDEERLRLFITWWKAARLGLEPLVLPTRVGESKRFVTLRRLTAAPLSPLGVDIRGTNGLQRNVAIILCSTLSQLLGIYRVAHIPWHGCLSIDRVELSRKPRGSRADEDFAVLVTGVAEAMLRHMGGEGQGQGPHSPCPVGLHSPPEAFGRSPALGPADAAEPGRPTGAGLSQKADVWSVGMLCYQLLLWAKPNGALARPLRKLDKNIRAFRAAAGRAERARVAAAAAVHRCQLGVIEAYEREVHSVNGNLEGVPTRLLAFDERHRPTVLDAMEPIKHVIGTLRSGINL